MHLEMFLFVVLWQQGFIAIRVLLEDQGRRSETSLLLQSLKKRTVQGDLNKLFRIRKH